MRFIRSMYSLMAIAFALLIGASTAWAGLPVVPIAVSAPTLSGWVLILLALLLAVVAYRALRERVQGRQR